MSSCKHEQGRGREGKEQTQASSHAHPTNTFLITPRTHSKEYRITIFVHSQFIHLIFQRLSCGECGGC
ncbi:hypothetical protein AAHA92_06356 [Salvia divinorum]|uniref:Uncharacterized protein n=1 Tax=Salvia divinorum TaxID=28513 RepID=A0ABD1I7N8_SALDI